MGAGKGVTISVYVLKRAKNIILFFDNLIPILGLIPQSSLGKVSHLG